VDDKDLIYEGIATVAGRYEYARDIQDGRQRPDLRRDCDDIHGLPKSFLCYDDKDLIYEGIATP